MKAAAMQLINSLGPYQALELGERYVTIPVFVVHPAGDQT